MCLVGYLATVLIIIVSEFASSNASDGSKRCFNVSNQHICYFQTRESQWTEWDFAWKECQENNSTLPIIENQEVQIAFGQYLKNMSIQNRNIWLGGRRKSEWQWINKKPFYQPSTSVSNFDLIHNHDNEVQAVISTTRDSSLSSNVIMKYEAVYPSHSYNYICQYKSGISGRDQFCQDTKSIRYENHSCLVVFNELSNLSVSRQKCIVSGGDLATFEGDENLIKVPKLYSGLTHGSRYYIGLQRNSWFWTRSNDKNSTMGEYRNWGDDNNYGNCLFARASDHKWSTTVCSYVRYFICQTIETYSTQETESASEEKQSDTYTTVVLIGAMAGAVLLFVILIIVILILKKRHQNGKVGQPDNINAYVKPNPSAAEKKSDVPAIYEEIQLNTTEKEEIQEPIQQSEATLYAEISAPSGDRNHNRPQDTNMQPGGGGGVVYAALDFKNADK